MPLPWPLRGVQIVLIHRNKYKRRRPVWSWQADYDRATHDNNEVSLGKEGDGQEANLSQLLNGEGNENDESLSESKQTLRRGGVIL